MAEYLRKGERSFPIQFSLAFVVDAMYFQMFCPFIFFLRCRCFAQVPIFYPMSPFSKTKIAIVLRSDDSRLLVSSFLKKIFFFEHETGLGSFFMRRWFLLFSFGK